MNERSFDFDGQLRMSEGSCAGRDLESVLLEAIPFAIAVEKATLADDKHGTDFWVTQLSGRRKSVDVKAREDDWCLHHPREDDVALETWSVLGKKIGWTRNPEKQTDYILFLWQETGRCMLVDFPMLCSVFCAHWQQWSAAYKRMRQTTVNKDGSRWQSECVFVPRKLIWAKIEEAFAGAPRKTPRHVNTQAPIASGMIQGTSANYYNPRQCGPVQLSSAERATLDYIQRCRALQQEDEAS